VSADLVLLIKKWQILIIVSSLFFVLFSQGCGKKGDPLPPDFTMPKEVTNLTARIDGIGVTLNWSISGKGSDVSRFRILRSERDAKNACRSCYGEQAIIAEFSVEDGELQTTNEGSFSYRDIEVVYGRSYAYFIYSCDGLRHCRGGSNTAEIEYNK
jgi:hypothetical protein